MNANHPNGRAFSFPGGRHGCLLIHGFTGTPGHMRYLGEGLKAEGYTVVAPLLPGHGLTLEEMRKTGWGDWLAAVRTAYSQLREKCDKVSVMGLSMGGTLALILAEEYPVDALVCLSAALRVQNPLTPLAPLIAPLVPFQKWGPAPEGYQQLTEYDCGYDGAPTKCVGDLTRLMHLASSNLFSVVAPALIVQPTGDETVRPVSARLIYDGISSKEKEIMWLQKSRHVCTIGPEREQVLAGILGLLRKIDKDET